MAEYRAYIVGDDGRFAGFEPLICDNDDDAVAKACSLLGGKDIELWNGPRLVTRLKAKKKPGPVTDDVKDGKRVPKE